ncbi:hypothetical protein FIBSPDRAFT_922684 [Athelia psychrophila]|uniref:Phosphatidylserine decarboxylase n=1 Tax=Athelia psychrophila TaxID=1759441 RepID=A0A165XC88_9AGAM|nr:hypothetical protein FIBSPDRAFT_922684 [Fibularhizoctonia sp. CBS 109695]
MSVGEREVVNCCHQSKSLGFVFVTSQWERRFGEDLTHVDEVGPALGKVELGDEVDAPCDLARGAGMELDHWTALSTVVQVLNTRFHTPVSKRETSPTYVPNTATFEFPLYLSLAHQLGSIELVEYLGEAAALLDSWFRQESDGVFGFHDPANQPYDVPLVSTRASTPTTGTVQIKLGFVSSMTTLALMEFRDVYNELVKRSRPSLVSAPPTEGIGTLRSYQHGPAYEGDGGISSGDSDNDNDGDQDPTNGEEDGRLPLLAHLYIGPEDLRDHDEGTLPAPSSSSLIPTTSNSTPTPNSTDLKPVTALVHSPTPVSAALTLPTPISSPASKHSPTLVPPPIRITPRPHNLALPHPASSSPVQKILRRPGASRTATSTSTSASVRSSSQSHPLQLEQTPTGKGGRNGRVGMRIALPPLPLPSQSTPTSSGLHTTPSMPTRARLRRGRGSLGGRRVIRDAKDKKQRKRKKGDFNFSPENDILGIVMLEIQGATDLPRLKNMTRTGWDMDSFVVISFGKKVFRTRIIRHSPNPTQDEKLLFHVRAYEASFKVQLTVLDWDNLSSNDYVGDANFSVAELMGEGQGLQVDERTGLYSADADGKHSMKEFSVPLSTGKEGVLPWEGKHNPVITFRAKYQPYAALRQQFWRQYLKEYDTEDTGLLSHLELTSMLDSLGSTLSAETISSFFTRNGKKAPEDELTMHEAVLCLETEVGRPREEKKRISPDEVLLDYSVPKTPGPGMGTVISSMQVPQLAKLDLSDPASQPMDAETSAGEGEDLSCKTVGHPMYATEYSQQPLSDTAAPGGGIKADLSSYPGMVLRPPAGKHQYSSAASSDAEEDLSESNSNSYPFTPAGGSAGGAAEETLERVINVKNCPLCHRPRLNKKPEVDIVTHLAVCASGNWAKIDRIVVGNFVTASQAQRKWYTKMIGKVSSGDYTGLERYNSANIIVQNRMTGLLEEEKMQVYARIGIRLFYKGAKSRMEGARACRLLKSMSIKQGIKYDGPATVRDIQPFIEFHRLDVTEIRDPIPSFKTFNQFLYRALKPEARPTEEPDNHRRIVSGADCRLMAFESVSEATRLWIKGHEFTVARLLGDSYKDQVDHYHGDYHRFHSPVDGPQAIRTTLDVYGENARKIAPIDSPIFGCVMAVCVGAMMVGSIKTTLDEGDEVQRGQEFGYVAFGGSTIVLLFEKGVEWDEDLLINGRASLETLVCVGMGIGCSRRLPNP